jgi:hypothetical protein
MRFRRSLLSRVFAVWFVVLIVLPFTAPFRAWDNRAPVSKANSDDCKPSDKLSKDATIAVCSPSTLVLTAGVAIERRLLRGPRIGRHTLPTVLRL